MESLTPPLNKKLPAMFMVLVRFLFKAAFMLCGVYALVSLSLDRQFIGGLVVAAIFIKIGGLFGPTPDEFKELIEFLQEQPKH